MKQYIGHLFPLYYMNVFPNWLQEYSNLCKSIQIWVNLLEYLDIGEGTDKKGQSEETKRNTNNTAKYMLGDHCHNQILSYYPRYRKTIGWYKKIGIQVLHIMMLNAHKFHCRYSEEKLSMYNFRLSVIWYLLSSYINPTKQSKSSRATNHLLAKCKTSDKGKIIEDVLQSLLWKMTLKGFCLERNPFSLDVV
jgi:hypothetical protein